MMQYNMPIVHCLSPYEYVAFYNFYIFEMNWSIHTLYTYLYCFEYLGKYPWTDQLNYEYICTQKCKQLKSLSSIQVTCSVKILQSWIFMKQCPKSNQNFRDITCIKCRGKRDNTLNIPHSFTIPPPNIMFYRDSVYYV